METPIFEYLKPNPNIEKKTIEEIKNPNREISFQIYSPLEN